MTTFQVGYHEVRVSVANERWTATVDGSPVPRWFTNEAEAWAAGVHEADRLNQAGAVGVLQTASSTSPKTEFVA
ncbi:MAG TPA: hypothetical protein VMK12_17910 [Anaeromyxobacteraceae bacterium]|nr:hypothetical protein [Anaeromyxobacteraceae bacterium]